KKVKGEFIKSGFFREELAKGSTGAGKSFSHTVDSISLGAPVNFRYHKVKTRNKEVGFFRLGMVTDLRNGFTHLGELKKAKKNPQLLQPKIEGLKAKLKILQRHPTKHRGEIESIQYALNQMKPKNLASTIRERRFIMENQMLQLVQGQIKENF